MNKTILLAYFPKITSKRTNELLRVFSSFEHIWEADATALAQTGWNATLIQEFLTWRSNVNEEAIEKNLEQQRITAIALNDPAYPPMLKELYDPPLCLFVRGTLPALEFTLAVVGTRKYSTYGKHVTEQFIAPLAQAGITIVSGLALGIDGIAHATSLRSKGTTVAVLGGGVDASTVQPSQHRQLAEAIVERGGALISEYPPGTQPTKFSFPRRNRIIAGLCRGTLVVEAGEKSGALITAQCALDMGRDVFAVPQNITSQTAVGTNNLLKHGAHLVTSANDILEILDFGNVKQFVENKQILPDSPTEANVLKHLTREPLHVDDLIRLSQLEGHIVTSTLTLMEMKGKVKNMGGMMYVLMS